MGSSTAADFPWRGHRLQLLAERAVWDPQQGALLVADLHLGKAESFQCRGIPLPSDGDGATLNALLDLVHRLRPARVVVLGDLIHSRLGLTLDLRQKLQALPALMGCPLRLIGGNHERGCWLEGLRQEPSMAMGPLWLSHAPEPRAGHLNICGHRHPVALVRGGADRLRLPCFAYDETVEQLVLPAFGDLTGGHPCRDRETLWLVANGAIVPWTSSPRRRQRPPQRPARGVHPAA
jgi:DNA ligase-associated metallophosphoesterase